MAMDFIRRHLKRILTDAAGYLLIIAALLTGWLPGPGGIPLALAGLALLSINNAWAKDLREWLLKNGGRLVTFLFPRNKLIQWLYDIVVVLLLILTGTLEARHAAIWQMSLGVLAFFLALLIALMNRDRLARFKHKR